jgi:copper transport protein
VIHRPGVRALLAALAGLLVLLALLATAAPASAHAELESTSPPDGTVLGRAPAELRLRFTESVTVPTGAVRVVAPSGLDVPLRRVGADGALVVVGLPAGLARGTYVVVWRVVADDSHPTSGRFTFSVGARSEVAATRTPSAPRALAAALGGLRWAGFLGTALSLGGLALVALCWPTGAGDPTARSVQVVGSLLVAGSASGSLLLKGPYDAGLGWAALGQGRLLSDVLATPDGRATLSRVVLALLLAAVVLAGSRLSASDRALAGGILGVSTIGTFVVSGHAVAGRLRALAVVGDAVHLAAMCVWLGGLALVLVAARRDGGREVVARFSRVAPAAVGALVLSGLVQSWRQVGSLTALTSTPYGHLLAAKTGLVVLTVAVATGTRALVRRRDPLESVRRSIALEVVLGASVLAVTAALVAAEPARSAWGP